MERSSERRSKTTCGYSLRSCRFVNGDTSHVLERDCGDFIEIIHLQGLIINQPGVVAAVGGIPDKLKIDGGISFLFPCPIFMVPNKLPLDPTARHQALLEAYKKSPGENAFKQGFIRAYKQAQGLSLEDEGEEQSMDQHVTMVEMNLAGPLDPCGLYLYPESIPTHPIPIKQAPVESESVKYGYYIATTEGPCGGCVQILGHDYGDCRELKWLKGVFFNSHGYVLAAGGIPRNLRRSEWASLSLPCISTKRHKILPQDPTERSESGVYVREGTYAFAITDALRKALLKLKSSKEGESGTKEEESGTDDLHFLTEMHLSPRNLQKEMKKRCGVQWDGWSS